MTQKTIERVQSVTAQSAGTSVQETGSSMAAGEKTSVFTVPQKKMRYGTSTGSIDAEQTVVFRKLVKKRVLKKLPQQTASAESAPVRNEAPQPEYTAPQPAPVYSEAERPASAEAPAAVKEKKHRAKLSCPAKTVFISLIFGLWNFMNFFVLNAGMKWQFYYSFIVMAAVYGMFVLDRWFTRRRYVVVSVIIQQITLLLSWGIFIKHYPEPLSHWTSLMFAVYHLFVPSLGVLAAVVIVAVFGAVVGITSAIRAKIRRAQSVQAARAEHRAESYHPTGVEEVLTDSTGASEALHNLASHEGAAAQEEESSSTVA